MLKVSVLGVAFFSFFLCASVASAGSLDEAKEHFAQGRFEEAMKKADAVLQDDADYGRARYLKGEIALMLGDVAQATEAFLKARKAKPKAEPILTGLGRAFLAAEEYAKAAKVLEEAVAVNAKSARAHCFLGIARFHDTLGKQGEKSIKTGLKLGPIDPVVAQAVVLFWLGEGELKEATKVADRFRKKRKKHPLGHFLKALALEQTKQYDGAIESYQKAIAQDENFLDAHKNLAILCIAQNPLYRDLKRTKLAMKHFESYRKLGGKDPRLIEIYQTLKQFIKGSDGR